MSVKKKSVVKKANCVKKNENRVLQNPKIAGFCSENKHEKSSNSTANPVLSDLNAAMEDISDAVAKLQGSGDEAQSSVATSAKTRIKAQSQFSDQSSENRVQIAALEAQMASIEAQIALLKVQSEKFK